MGQGLGVADAEGFGVRAGLVVGGGRGGLAHLFAVAWDAGVAFVCATAVLFGFGFRGARPDDGVPVEEQDRKEGEEDQRDCEADSEFGVIR